MLVFASAIAGLPESPPPIELWVAPTYRGARTQLATEGSTSDIADGHYGLRLRAEARVLPWLTFEIDATQALLNLWMETEPRMQRYGRLRATAGANLNQFALRGRWGIGQEGIVTTSAAGPRQYFSIPVTEIGAEASIRGPFARLVVGMSHFGWARQPSAQSVDATLVVPNHTRFGGVIGYDYRALRGTWTHDGPASVIDDRNHSISVGLVVRPRWTRSRDSPPDE